KMLDQALDVAIGRRLVGNHALAFQVHIDSAGRQVFNCLANDLETFQHFIHAHQVTSKAVAGLGADHFEVKILVREIRLVLAKITDDAAGASDRPAATQVDRVFSGQDANALAAVDKDAITIQQATNVRVGFRKRLDEVADFLNPDIGHVGG